MSLRGKRVLLVEDEQADYEIVRHCISRASTECELKWATTLAEAKSQLHEHAFDVVLTDLSLADSSGLETVKALRQFDTAIPIVVMTTLDDERVERESLDAGAQDYLLKDQVSSHTLERTIEHAVLRQQSISEKNALLEELHHSHEQLQQQQELLKRKNRRLKRLYKTAHRFVDNVSHEFRTPLTVIKDYLSLIRDGLVGEVSQQQKQMLDVAAVRADDLNNMVDDMLDVSKLESGTLGAWRRNCHVKDIVEQVVPALAQKAGVKGINFSERIPENLPEVYADADKAGRVIINLVTNAMKFCGEPGAVELWAELNTDAREVIVGATDNGSGIEPEQLQEIFKRFKQIRRDIKSSTKGFGLGLNIARELVDLNLGEMNVQSQPNCGSTFSFSIPLAEPQGVIQRYARRVRDGANVSLIEAGLDETVAETEAEDADTFFNFLLRRNDLLFRAGTHRWLIVLASGKTEAEKYTVRAQVELTKANRNRPFGPLPEFEMDIVGTWQMSRERDDLLSTFDERLACESRLQLV